MVEEFKGETQLPSEGQSFEDRFPADRFVRVTNWTAPGSSEGVRDRVMETVDRCLRLDVQIATIEIERLPDGGYEIKSAYSIE